MTDEQAWADSDPVYIVHTIFIIDSSTIYICKCRLHILQDLDLTKTYPSSCQRGCSIMTKLQMCDREKIFSPAHEEAQHQDT